MQSLSTYLHNSSAHLFTRAHSAIDENVPMTHLLPVRDLKMGFIYNTTCYKYYSGPYIPISIKKVIKNLILHCDIPLLL